MKKLISILSLAILLVAAADAQDYKTALGFRLGLYNGITVKHFISRNSALEGLLSTRWSGFEITGLYEIHHEAFNVDKLKWFYGAGAHVGFYGSSYPGGSVTVLGVDGILGLEYSFDEIPINVGLDWKPSINLLGYSHFFGDGAALSIRYTF